MRLPGPAIAEIIEALETGRAPARMQNLAARIAPSIVNGGRLPPGISLNHRGRPAKGAWTAPRKARIKGDWPDKYEALQALSRADASPTQQKYIAWGMRWAIAEFKLFVQKKHDGRGRPKSFKVINERTGLAEFVEILADVYRRNGSRCPIEDALREIAEVHEDGALLATVRRRYKEGLAEPK